MLGGVTEVVKLASKQESNLILSATVAADGANHQANTRISVLLCNILQENIMWNTKNKSGLSPSDSKIIMVMGKYINVGDKSCKKRR